MSAQPWGLCAERARDVDADGAAADGDAPEQGGQHCAGLAVSFGSGPRCQSGGALEQPPGVAG